MTFDSYIPRPVLKHSCNLDKVAEILPLSKGSNKLMDSLVSPNISHLEILKNEESRKPGRQLKKAPDIRPL